MTGYNGYSKSNNAVAAEAEGRFPLSRAVPIVAKAAAVTAKVAREALLAIGSHEWHHSSKKFNRVGYYDTAVALVWLRHRPDVAKLEAASFHAKLNACFGRHPGQSGTSCAALGAELDAAYASIQAETGVKVGVIESVFYNAWEG